jgi:6-pyruvoyltetrahydropterin/6-carboxytetrahydropterin synthase
MYILKTRHDFDSSHFLANYDGKCANIHGHRWEVEVEVASEVLIKDGEQKGMVVDFGDLKKYLRGMLDEFDHALIIETNSMRDLTLKCLIEDGFKVIEVPFRPTAEHFAKYFYDRMESEGFGMHQVTVYETPINCATYRK